MNFTDILLEMIEDELRKLRSMGMEDIDRIDAGPYKMFLLKNQTFHYDSLYDVALTSDDEDFTTPHAQRDRPIGHQMIDIARNWKRLSNKLRQWSIEYGDLRVGSMNRNKTAKYRRILSTIELPVGPLIEVPTGSYFILYGPKESSDSNNVDQPGLEPGTY
jgi:hypothetical protein